ncbi:MAG TPA: UDP-glucose/GDP-mannose dehydrogenase family protein [Noviherbaspirillum sp.]|uniref:UDP-glucose dehydrogenase family protein n=1 Tax=Noviherbaspirillum sp. TaxID=1926288 RepID=UPI002DDCDF59|nr:UDP-glucose/GDP-mannose dehydrogenase family protein [Noviherbaspirillum sp.]HEV2608647.1 UDP-glucose/GDP-mannose dehydrogenase family protein [Noviherbaspirillum sp.]
MKITVIGSGYVGLVTGACLSEYGNDVFFLDVDREKIGVLDRGGMPIHEPGLKQMIDRHRSDGRIRFSTDVAAGVAHGEILFIAVGTPPGEDGSADLQYVLAAARSIGRYMDGFKTVVNKSTVPVGTALMVKGAIAEELRRRDIADVDGRFSVVSNPEFLKEGAAINDFMRPDRIVIGSDDDPAGSRARAMMKALYAPFTRNHERIMYMDVRSAEFTKYAANAMLATRISFMNELANLADCLGADIELVRQGIGSDPRIGFSFLYAGTGYGGSCFPKDVRALLETARSCGQSLRILDAVEQVNQDQKCVLCDKLVRKYGEDLSGYTFALWGLAFKPNTDDMREAPSLSIAANLLRRGASIHAFDPVAIEQAAGALKNILTAPEFERVTFYDDQMAALYQCDALVIVTEWKVFQSPDFGQIKSLLNTATIFDGRNMYEPSQMRSNGFDYHAIGRPGVMA